MKKLLLLSGGVLCSTLLSFALNESQTTYASNDLTIKDSTVSEETVSFLLNEELMVKGTPEKTSWSSVKHIQQSISKDSAKELVSKSTKGEACECTDSQPSDPDKKDDTTIDQQTFALIEKYGA